MLIRRDHYYFLLLLILLLLFEFRGGILCHTRLPAGLSILNARTYHVCDPVVFVLEPPS